MRCWYCRAKLNPEWVQRDGLLRGRDESEGGPYRVYPCPSCRRENRIEAVGEGKFYASPAKDLGLVDWLVGWIEPLAPDDFLELQEWQQKFGEERRLIFERAGSVIYSGLRWRQWLSRRPSIELHEEESSTEEKARLRDQPRAGEIPTNQKRSELGKGLPLDHPLKILGLHRNASATEIRRKFRDLVKRYHPDKHRSLDDSQIELASRKLKQLIDAYEKLENDGKV